MKNSLGKKLRDFISTFLRKEEGAVAIIVGLLFIVILGFAGLAIDASFWFGQQRQLQFAADAGAVDGAMTLKTLGGILNVTNAAKASVGANCNAVNLNLLQTGCKVVAVNNPPTSGPNTGNISAVEVIVSTNGPTNSFFSQLFLAAPTVKARAVAGNKPSNNCIISLATSGIGIDVKGGGSISSPNCGVASDSTSNKSINLVGNGAISTNTVQTPGGINGAGNITATQGITTGSASTSDPFSGLVMPTISGAIQNNFSMSGGTQTISPGDYVGGIKLTSNSNLTMQPGVYFMNQGDFDIGAQATVTGTGVTIVMTSSTGSGYGSVKINGGSTINLSSPSTGTTAGVLFFGDRNSSGLTEKIDGGSTQVLSGAIYFPTNSIDWAGNSGTASPCLQLIASTITLTGGGSFGNNCPNTNSNAGLTVLLE